MNGFDLIVFDVDDTIADRYSDVMYPYVANFIQNNRHLFFALATNQGGVGLRYWMQHEGFGNYEHLPTQIDVEYRISKLLSYVPRSQVLDLVCYAYISKKTGKASPIPPLVPDYEVWRWDAKYRKPNPGMLLMAIDYYKVCNDRTLFIGDHTTDEKAAFAAGCHFRYAYDMEWE